MSGNLPESDQTLWVVVKADGGVDPEFAPPVVEEQGYWVKEKADTRAAHVRRQDGLEAWVYPVRFWSPTPTAAQMPVPAPEWPPLVGAVTIGRGQELNGYANLNGGPPLRLSDASLHEVVSRTWDAWRVGQATAGNLLEAGQEPPAAALRSLLEDSPQAFRPAGSGSQLELPFPAHA